MAPANASPSPRRRRITRIVAAACLLLGLGSCTSVLGLDGYANVAVEMCSLLDHCYDKTDKGGCQAKIDGFLSGDDHRARADLLTSIIDNHCLESCRASRVCVDLAPLCSVTGSCARREDCCGSLEGHADCQAAKCCATRGSECALDTDCCDDAGSCVAGICGKQRCVEAKQACTYDVECCTGACNNHRCAKTTCSENKFECAIDKDCCSGFCAPGLNLCATPPTCAAKDEACTLETDCCAGTHCRRDPGSIAGRCSAEECTLDSGDCATDDRCCSGHCDTSLFFCANACAAENSACAVTEDCCAGTCQDQICKGDCSTTYCARDADCCSGACVTGVCKAVCSSPTSHTPCTAGGPLGNDDDTTKLCVEAVCTVDPYCCCVAWDDACVEVALAQGQSCTYPCH